MSDVSTALVLEEMVLVEVKRLTLETNYSCFSSSGPRNLLMNS